MTSATRSASGSQRDGGRRGAGGGEHVGGGVLGRRREAADGELQQLRAADAGDRADRDDGVERRAGHRPLEVGDQQLDVDLLAAEVAVHQGLVLGLLDHALDQVAAQRLQLVVAGLEQPGQRGHVAPLADRHVERLHLVAERVLRLPQHAVVVGPGLVELRDHHGTWHPDLGTLAPHVARPVVDALVGRDHEQRTVGGAQPGAELTDEVGVPGGVDQVDLRALVEQRSDGEGARPAVLLLARVEVADGVPVLDRPRARHGSGSGEQRLDEGRLAGATGPDQDDVPDPIRAARLEILPGWSTSVPLVGHGATSCRKGNSGSARLARGRAVLGRPVRA